MLCLKQVCSYSLTFYCCFCLRVVRRLITRSIHPAMELITSQKRRLPGRYTVTQRYGLVILLPTRGGWEVTLPNSLSITAPIIIHTTFQSIILRSITRFMTSTGAIMSTGIHRTVSPGLTNYSRRVDKPVHRFCRPIWLCPQTHH